MKGESVHQWTEARHSSLRRADTVLLLLARRIDAWAPGLIVALALLLRLDKLGAQPLWRDESLVYWLGSLPLSVLWSRDLALTGTHPPLFYTIHHLWIELFGGPEAARSAVLERLPSVIIGTATVYAAYLACRDLADRRAGLFAGALMAAATGMVSSSQEGKAAALVSFLMLLVAWSAARLIRALAGEDTAESRAAIRRAGLAYVVSGIALAYSHSTGPIGIAIVNLAFVACLIGAPHPWRALLVWSIANLLIVLAFAPFLPAMWEVSAQRIGYYWLPPSPGLGKAYLHMQSIANQSLRLPGVAGAVPPILALLAAAAGFLGCLWLRWTRDDFAALFFAAATVSCPTVFLVVSHLSMPVFQLPVLMAQTLPVMIPMIALGFAALQPSMLRAPIAVLVVAAYLIGGLAPTAPWKEPWNAVARSVAQAQTPGDAVLFWPPYAQWSMDFYMPNPPTGREYLLDLDLHSEFRPFRAVPFVDVAAARAVLEATDHAWIVLDSHEVQASEARARIDAITALLPGRAIREQSFQAGLLVLEVSSANSPGRQ